MLSNADDSNKSWLDVLPSRELFDHLRKNCGGGSVNMCSIRGNLFVWNRLSDRFCDGEVLTLNLNRLFASPKNNSFQILKCTKVFGKTCGLIPDESGVYLAVHFDKGLTVLQLSYDRGEHGEFGGGKKCEVLCRNFSVAEPLFARYDRLSLIQVSWYLPTPDSLALLTSDNFIRLYSLAEADCPLLQVPLLSPYVHHPQRERLVIQDDCVIGFSLRNKSAFILHENGELSLVSLAQDTRLHVPQRMRMFPLSEDDDEIYSSSMLLLDTSPNLVVVAHKSGMIYHCVYLEADSEDGEDDHNLVSGMQKLYVMERIQIRSSDMDQLDDLDLVSVALSFDPANPHGYFVTTVSGVYCIHLPWLGKLEAFATATSNLPFLDGKEECQVTHLVHTELPSNSVLGITIVWEPLLGYALVSLTSGDWECMTLSLEEPQDLRGADDYLDDEADTLPLETSYAERSSFVKTIENILHPPGQALPPILKNVAKEVELKSQSDLFGFLMARITETKQISFIRQHEALQVMSHKIQALKRLKEQIISNSVELMDEADIAMENSDQLQDKLTEVIEANVSLQKQADRLACKIQFLSPVFSEAEECMKKEMEGLTKHIQEMKVATLRAGEKSKLFQIMTVHPEIDLSEAQSTTLLNQLTNNADKVKSLAAVVKILCDLTRTL